LPIQLRDSGREIADACYADQFVPNFVPRAAPDGIMWTIKLLKDDYFEDRDTEASQGIIIKEKRLRYLT
jgi:hypothetical protein